MLLIVDAYNILKQVSSVLFIEEGQRDAFIKKIERYAYEKNNSVILVFDGGGYVRPTKYLYGLVTVIYAGINDSADDVIKQMIMRGVNPAQTVVVSSDRDLCNFAANFQVPSLGSHDFYQLIQQQQQEKQRVAKKIVGVLKKAVDYESSAEIDALMEEASTLGMYKQEDIVSANRKSSARQEAKRDKKLKRVVKKL